ncbi:MAG: NAD(+)/NADH kinase, partial [Planctomycetota bacterium]
MPDRGNGRPARAICWAERIHLPVSRKPRVLVLADPLKNLGEEADRIVQHLGDRVRLIGPELSRSLEPIRCRPDLVIVLGGDGAMLATSHRLGSRPVPVLGVNFGRIGFLAAVSPDRAEFVLDQVLAGEGRCEGHAMMRAIVQRGGESLLDTHILNEVVVQRSWGSSMVEIDLTVDRRPVCTYRGDGLIVATATGSTAYSMSAGGPVLSPRLDAWVVTPIAPHSLNQRPVVLPGQRSALLQVNGHSGFTADGHLEARLEPGDLVRVRPSKRKFHLVVDP